MRQRRYARGSRITRRATRRGALACLLVLGVVVSAAGCGGTGDDGPASDPFAYDSGASLEVRDSGSWRFEGVTVHQVSHASPQGGRVPARRPRWLVYRRRCRRRGLSPTKARRELSSGAARARHPRDRRRPDPGGATCRVRLRDMAKMQANKPDVIAFNGYALQDKDNPVPVKRGETVRMYVLNAGPSIWSAFHVIGTVFDTAHTDNGIAHDVQTINLAPSQGGWVDFTLDAEGAYPFVTHAFGDAVKGAIGVLKTAHAPAAAGHDMGGSHAMPATSAQGDAAPAVGDVNVTLGDMWVKADTPTVKAGKVSFAVKNEGATVHGLAIAPTPVKQSGGMLDDSALVGKGKELGGGESETVSWDLKPGSYELVCFMPGHYAAGQKLPFTVE
jgi:uncharacterized cupredoxin-like copper-binding protein